MLCVVVGPGALLQFLPVVAQNVSIWVDKVLFWGTPSICWRHVPKVFDNAVGYIMRVMPKACRTC